MKARFIALMGVIVVALLLILVERVWGVQWSASVMGVLTLVTMVGLALARTAGLVEEAVRRGGEVMPDL